ncbi:CD209 antigen-like protein C [Varanus komodoensis]|uniref:CD209 antigen-like protein C n=1 Tax=Varanus komodoensis TaxID=61221 RepID=UPI001CF7E834|nr:CD209 antigen-like protein C [Varanus komodoensis]
MAPKGKAAAADGKKREPAPRLKNLRLKIVWAMLGTVALISLVMLIVMSYLSMKIADYVVKLPDYLQRAEESIKNQKTQYKSLFRKGGRSASGWQLFGKSLYYISKGEKSWYDAENFCLSRDAHLTSIVNEEEQEFITSQLDEPAWIGLTDEHEEGTWEWTDGSTLLAEYWSEGKPSRARHYGEVEHDCAAIVPSVHGDNWSDADCHGRNRWVCKESLDARGG